MIVSPNAKTNFQVVSTLLVSMCRHVEMKTCGSKLNQRRSMSSCGFCEVYRQQRGKTIVNCP